MRPTLRAVGRMAAFLPVLTWRGLFIGFSALLARPENRALTRARWQMKSCRVFCRRLGVTVRVVDRSGIDPEHTHRALLAVSNHLGVLDPWMLASTMPMAFAAKAEMASWPLMGRICKNVGIVFVERQRRMETTKFVDEVRDRMRHGVRVLVFPEGTTSEGPGLLPFKTGGFEAVAGMDDGAVLPIYMVLVSVAGRPATEEEQRMIGWVTIPMMEHAMRALSLESPVVEVRIGAPIATAGRDRKELADLSREAILALAAG